MGDCSRLAVSRATSTPPCATSRSKVCVALAYQLRAAAFHGRVSPKFLLYCRSAACHTGFGRGDRLHLTGSHCTRRKVEECNGVPYESAEKILLAARSIESSLWCPIGCVHVVCKPYPSCIGMRVPRLVETNESESFPRVRSNAIAFSFLVILVRAIMFIHRTATSSVLLCRVVARGRCECGRGMISVVDISLGVLGGAKCGWYPSAALHRARCQYAPIL
eukprot:scaffold115374_cov26-Tisochrysis_lutea.AAC.3